MHDFPGRQDRFSSPDKPGATDALLGIGQDLLLCAIMIVDDDITNHTLLTHILNRHGFSNILALASAEEALARIKSFRPDLILMDLMMPGINGFDCCRIIRRQPEYHDLPILVQTGITEPELRVKAFASGATDFVSKPVYPDELCARIMVHLENRLLMRNLLLYKERIESELETARHLQHAILPAPEDIIQAGKRCRLTIASHFQPSSEIGGDFWGLKHVGEQQTALWMVDFSGHGVPAALNSFRLQAYLNESSELENRPGEYLSRLNDKLLDLLLNGQFATMFYGLVDTQANQLHYCVACTPHPIILRHASGTGITLDGTGMPLGIASNTYATQTIDFLPGDTLVLYSDALIETEDEHGEYISTSDVMTFLSHHTAKRPADLLRDLLTYFHENAIAPVDDLTLCICKRELEG